VGNNPLKYIDPTGDVKVIPADINLAMFVTESLGFAAQFQGVGL
jgi:hypothetical protein